MRISRRIDDLLGINPMCGEPVQGQRYLPGQQFKPHNDWFYTTEKYWQLERKRGGQRSWTAMAFLNQVEEGGETRSEEHTSELQSLMRISYAVFCLKKKTKYTKKHEKG